MRDSYEDSPAGAREAGLRRLGRLTWRTAQLGALATVGFAIVFARTASAPAANLTPNVPATEPPTAAATPFPSTAGRSTKPHGSASAHPSATQSTAPAQPG